MSLHNQRLRQQYLPVVEPLSPIENAIMVQETNIHEDDNIYYNIVMNHPVIDYSNLPAGRPISELDTRAVYSVTRDVPLLSKASEYYCSVIRFDIPLNRVPIMIMPIVPNQSNPNLTPFVMGITYNGTDYYNQLNYINNSSSPLETPPVQDVPGVQVITPYYYVYSYSRLIEMMNKALLQLWGSSGLAALFPGYIAPYFIYSPVSLQLIVPNCFHSNQSPAVGVPTIYCNLVLFSNYLSSFSGFFYGIDQPFGKDIRFILAPDSDFPVLSNVTPYYPPGLPSPLTSGGGDTGSCPCSPPQYRGPTGQAITDYWQVTNEYSTFPLWNSLRKIVLISNTIATRQEGIPGGITVTTNGISSNPGVASTLPILADFVPQIELPGDTRSVAYYLPEAQYKLIDLISDLPLTRIDAQLFWQDKDQNLYPIFLSPNQTASIKLGFFRKNLYKNFRTDYGGRNY